MTGSGDIPAGPSVGQLLSSLHASEGGGGGGDSAAAMQGLRPGGGMLPNTDIQISLMSIPNSPLMPPKFPLAFSSAHDSFCGPCAAFGRMMMKHFVPVSVFADWNTAGVDRVHAQIDAPNIDAPHIEGMPVEGQKIEGSSHAAAAASAGLVDAHDAPVQKAVQHERTTAVTTGRDMG